MDFPLSAYLDRIGLGAVPAGAEGLASVQEAHMRAIPFENLDPLLGIVPSLDPADLAEKLITRRRGGYCYEHNALFGAALRALGFAPITHLARVRNGANQGGARSHQAFTVEAGGERWLCDTGFGGHGALIPLRLGTPEPQGAPNGTYRLRVDAVAGETVLERRAGADWVSLYGFDEVPVRAVDLEAANFLCARWTGAPFSENLMVAFHSPAGRIGLFNRALTRGDEARVLASEDELSGVFEDCGLAIDQGTIARVWQKIESAPTSR